MLLARLARVSQSLSTLKGCKIGPYLFLCFSPLGSLKPGLRVSKHSTWLDHEGKKKDACMPRDLARCQFADQSDSWDRYRTILQVPKSIDDVTPSSHERFLGMYNIWILRGAVIKATNC